MKTKQLTILAILFVALPSSAAWTLDNGASQISFVSVKAADAGEAHRFTQVSGMVSADGNASVEIQLASVDTMIPVRDERMREMLFETDLFPTAMLSTKLDSAMLGSIPPGDSKDVTADITLNLHGQTVVLTADMQVARLGNHRLMVSSRKPVIVNAASVDLVDGIEALREVANLPSISKAVPVSFVLTFVED